MAVRMTGMTATVSIGPCQGCGACLLTCPVHAIRPLAGALIVLDDRCTGCGECVEICPVDAIRFVTAHPLTPPKKETRAMGTDEWGVGPRSDR